MSDYECEWKKNFHRRNSAFSLLEILVVLAIVSSLALLLVPRVSETQNNLRLKSSAMLVADYLRLGRQMAVSSSVPVEVVLFEISDAAGARWAGIQLANKITLNAYETNDGSAFDYTPATKPLVLTAPVQFSTHTANSTLHSLPINPDLATLSPGVTNARSFVFFADGSTNLDPEEVWSLTLVLQKDAASATPRDFVTILIDPVSGRSRSYQP